MRGCVQYAVTRTYYDKVDGHWIATGSETTMESEEHVKVLLSDTPQPFESSHRLYKQAAGRHRFDTYETINCDGTRRFTAFVDFK